MLMAAGATLALAGGLSSLLAPPEHVSFRTQDGGVVYADVYGKGGRGVVLAHGGRFDKGSWEKREQYERAPPPKELLVLEGSAHAQFIFETEQGERLMREILRFLSEP